MHRSGLNLQEETAHVSERRGMAFIKCCQSDTVIDCLKVQNRLLNSESVLVVALSHLKTSYDLSGL